MDFYERYYAALKREYDVVVQCPHEPRQCETRYSGLGAVQYCMDCFRATTAMRDTTRAEYKRARKAQLAAEPRCELCSKRATKKVGINDVLMCGRHFKKVQSEFYRRTSGTIWLPGPPTTRDYVLKLAQTDPS